MGAAVSCRWSGFSSCSTVAGFAAYLARALDFFGTGLNILQLVAGAVAAMLLLTALTLAWPRSPALWRTAFALNAIDLAVDVSISLWTGGDIGNPMRFCRMHANSVSLVLVINLGWPGVRRVLGALAAMVPLNP